MPPYLTPIPRFPPLFSLPVQGTSYLHTTDTDAEDGGGQLRSVIERNDLDELMAMADLQARLKRREREPPPRALAFAV